MAKNVPMILDDSHLTQFTGSEGESMPARDLPHRGLDEWRVAITQPNGQTVELHQLLDRLPAGAYVCDPNGLITYYNQRAVELWGRAPRLNNPEDRFCGSSRLYSAEDGQPVRHDQCWMALALREQRPLNNREIIIGRPDGERVSVLKNANPIWNNAGELVGAVNVLLDITDRKRAEAEQRRLREALLKRGHLSFAEEMAAGIAHELNQPLTAIINYSEVCTNVLRSGEAKTNTDTDTLLAAIEQVGEQSQRAARILRSLRALMHKAPLQQEPADMHALIDKAVSYIMTANDELQQGACLRVEVLESLPRVKADPIQIKLVLVNLMRNALEAMSGSDLERRELTVEAEPGADNTVTVTVRDTGCGFAEGVHELLFYPFFTTKPEGIGLGLPICASIIEAHGGQLWAAANHDVGTSFHFSLPCVGSGELDGASEAADEIA